MKTELDQIREELRELRAALNRPAPPAPRPDDLVDAHYISARTGLAVRSILEGKAGTKTIPRIELRSDEKSRPLIRFPRRAVDRFVADLVEKALNRDVKRRTLKLLKRKPRGTKAA